MYRNEDGLKMERQKEGIGGMCIFFFKQKTAYEIGTGDWSSDVCSSDLLNEIAWLETFVFLSICDGKTQSRLSINIQS